MPGYFLVGKTMIKIDDTIFITGAGTHRHHVEYRGSKKGILKIERFNQMGYQGPIVGIPIKRTEVNKVSVNNLKLFISERLSPDNQEKAIEKLNYCIDNGYARCLKFRPILKILHKSETDLFQIFQIIDRLTDSFKNTPVPGAV